VGDKGRAEHVKISCGFVFLGSNAAFIGRGSKVVEGKLGRAGLLGLCLVLFLFDLGHEDRHRVFLGGIFRVVVLHICLIYLVFE
jgi:hypothetical protein